MSWMDRLALNHVYDVLFLGPKIGGTSNANSSCYKDYKNK